LKTNRFEFLQVLKQKKSLRWF